jgi:hypothetical protein
MECRDDLDVNFKCERYRIQTPGIEGFQIYKTPIPTHKVMRFVTALGPVEMMASRKCGCPILAEP